MTKRKFFIDTDTASDDAVALLMALEYPDVEVLGISIVSGNMPVEQGSINARYTIELCEKNVPVYVGSDKPMVKKREHADWFHGPDGMGNMNYPDPQLNEDNSDYMDVLQSLVEQYYEKAPKLASKLNDESDFNYVWSSICSCVGLIESKQYDEATVEYSNMFIALSEKFK